MRYEEEVRMKRYIVSFLILILVVSLGLTGCSPKATAAPNEVNKEDIVIGWVAPLTGTAANEGQQLFDGASLAIKEINDAGGIDGRLLVLEPQDDKSDPKEAANIATKFTSNDKIVAVIGNYNSSCALAGIPIYNEAKLPMIQFGTSPVITKEHGPYVFRLSVTDAFQGKFVTEWAFADGYKNPALLFENNDYGRGLADVVESEMAALGGKIAIKETYMMGETKDFTGILTKVKDTDADSLFIAGLYTEGALIAKQAKQLGIDLPIYSNEALFEKIYIDLAGEAAEGTKVCGLLIPTDPNPIVQKFLTDYKAATNKDGGTFAAFGYDAAKIIAKAIETVGDDREKITEYLKTMPEFEGVSGNITFDSEHDAARSELKKLIVKDGSFELVQ
jgi:branched-chain amino acid transport system substrate-binding protein